MGSNLAALREYRQTLVVSTVSLGATAALGVALWALGALTRPVGRGLLLVALPAALLAGLSLIVAAVTVAVHASLPTVSTTVKREEPLLARPRMSAIRRDSPFIVIMGVAPKSGASTLACNLAILVAREGQSPGESEHRPRPLCLLNRREGPDQLELDDSGLARYLTTHPTTARDDIVDLAVRHPSGVEFLSIADGGPNAFQLRQMLPVLRRHYDLIVFDAGTEDRWLADAAMELADAIILTSLQHPDGKGVIDRWSERIWGLGLEGKTVLARNRREAFDPPMPRYRFQFVLELTTDSAIVHAEEQGIAWATAANSNAVRLLRAAVRTLLPRLFAGADRR